MSPQKPYFNRGIWKELEEAVRKLDAHEDIWETYVICGPVFYFDQPVQSIGSKDDNGVSIPIPNAYFKSVLTEDKNGDLHMWSFLLANEKSDKPLSDFLVPTKKVEKLSGLVLWETLVGNTVEREKSRIRKMWKI